jgi:hypothetical protein
MKGDEFKIILEDINEKFDVIIEGHKLLNEKLDRQIGENRAEHKEIKDEILLGRYPRASPWHSALRAD